MITPEMIADGLDAGTVSIVDSPHNDGPVCQIGDYWFWFAGGEAEQTTAADYAANVPREDIVREIMDVLNDFRTLPENRDEYAYYEAYLRENTQNQRDSKVEKPVNAKNQQRGNVSADDSRKPGRKKLYNLQR